MGFLVVVIVFSILIIVHEGGHFIMAKKLGVKVEKFSIGFGKKLFSWNRGGTEFMICAVPLGGFVKLAGDERDQCKGGEEEFFSHPIWHRGLIVAMGPIVNFVFAYVCFYLVFISGFPILKPQVGQVMEGPAMTAGILEQDVIVKIDEHPITSWDDIPEYISEAQGKKLLLSVDRAGEVVRIPITPKLDRLENAFGQKMDRWIIGIVPSGETALKRYGLIESLGLAGEQLWRITSMTYKALYRVITGALPAKDALAGPIVIFGIIKDAAAMGIAYLTLTTAVISASLAIINLFPIPVLDGGHLLFLLIEKLRGRPLPLKVEENMVKIGFSLLMCLMVFVLYNDIQKSHWVEKIKSFATHLNPQTQSE